MSDAWLPVPDFADVLGVTASHVRELLRDGAIIGVRRGDRNVLQIPAGFVVDVDGAAAIVPTLRGTLTLLRDAGFSDEAAAQWLLESNDELGTSPIEALRSGQRAHVRRLAQALL